MKKKKTAKKTKKITVSLTLRDFEKITMLAKEQKTSRPIVAKRLMKSQLASIQIEKNENLAKNQLGLFDSMQIDIFDNRSKTWR